MAGRPEGGVLAPLQRHGVRGADGAVVRQPAAAARKPAAVPVIARMERKRARLSAAVTMARPLPTLFVRAANLLQARAAPLPPVRVVRHKASPATRIAAAVALIMPAIVGMPVSQIKAVRRFVPAAAASI